MPPPQTTPHKNQALEGLRGLASLSVVFGHFAFVFLGYLGTLWRPTPGAHPRFALERILEVPPLTLLFSADAAVSVFFVMSGYVLTRRFLRTGAVEELQSAAAKRYIRLVLPSLAAVMLAWVLWRSGAILTAQATQIGAAGWVQAYYQERFTIWQALVNGAIGAPLFGYATLDPPLWTIQVELIGSILLFAMLALFGRGRPLLLAFWFLFFANVLGYALPNGLYYLSVLAGALLHHAEPWLRRNPRAALGLFLTGLACAAYSASPVFDVLRHVKLPNLQPTGPDFGTLPRLTWHTIGAILLVAGTLGSPPVVRLLSARSLLLLGRISFAMYLVHMPLLMSLGLCIVRQAQKSGLSYLASVGVGFIVFIPTVLLVSVLFERFIDAPSIRLANRVAAERRPAHRSIAAPVSPQGASAR